MLWRCRERGIRIAREFGLRILPVLCMMLGLLGGRRVQLGERRRGRVVCVEGHEFWRQKVRSVSSVVLLWRVYLIACLRNELWSVILTGFANTGSRGRFKDYGYHD
jgi:hypothetical protein